MRLIAVLLAIALPWAMPARVLAIPQAKAALLYNVTNGQTLYAAHPDLPLAPASLTKIMTMFLTMDAIRGKKLRLNEKIPIHPTAAKTGGSAMGLSGGERVPVVRLLAGMAVASGNDAATAIALHLGGGSQQKFVSQMNKKARQLGMSRTTYVNPTGLPATGQKTTARDLLRLCRAYFKAYPQAARFHSMTFFMHKGGATRNTNPLLGRLQGVDGIKTGWTVASGYNLIASAKRGNTRLLAIVLGCSSKEGRDAFATKLLEAGFRHPANAALVKKAVEH